MQIKKHISNLHQKIESFPTDEEAQKYLIHILRQYELLRGDGISQIDAFFSVITAPNFKKNMIEKKHAEMEKKEQFKKRSKRSEKWRTLDRYSGELLHLNRELQYGSRRLEKWLWATHRKKVSYMTISRWLSVQNDLSV